MVDGVPCELGLDGEIQKRTVRFRRQRRRPLCGDLEIELEVPVSLEESSPPMRMTVKVSAGYSLGFNAVFKKFSIVPIDFSACL